MANLHEIAALDAINIVAEAEVLINNGHRRSYFNRLDPFQSLSEKAFIRHFRLNKEVSRNLIAMLNPYLKAPGRKSDLDKQTKVLVALNFFASGSYQLDVGENVFLRVSQSSVSRCVEEVSTALNRSDVLNQWIKSPTTVRECEILRQQFFQKYGFPGVIGIIDCTHVAIVPPDTEEEYQYVNRKHYHSIKVQLIYNSDMVIINAVARYPGSTHDSYIWNRSSFQRVIQNLYRRTRSFYLLGDLGYPLRPCLLTPLEGQFAPNSPKASFSENFKRTRTLIERCNGVLKMRFRCLLKHRVLHYKPEKAAQIINSCIVLHNMCIANRLPDPEMEEGDNEIDFGMYDHVGIVEQHPVEARQRINPDLSEGRSSK